MIDLQCSIISLRSAGIRFAAEYLAGDCIFFHQDGISYLYDLASGAVQPYDWERKRLYVSQETAYRQLYPENDFKFASLSSEERESYYRKWMSTYCWDDVITPTSDVLGVILSLASHQVKGDELIKGLKAMGLQMPVGFKIVSLYTGGWRITYQQDNYIEDYDVESFALALLDP